jgi:hypothetical protein
VPGRSARDEEPSGAEDLSGLPVRLRERLERELAREDSGLPPLRGWLIAATVVAALSVVLILMQRFGAIDVPLLRGPAGTQANHSSSDQPELQTSPGTNPSGTTAADTIAPVVAPPKPKPIVQTVATRAPASRPTRSRVTSNSNEVGGVDTPVPSGAPTSTSTAASTPAPASTTGYGVSVAAFLDDERANQERERLATATGFPAIVMPFDDAGTTMYQVVLGRWPSSRAAERAANGLMEQGVINEARVTKLPKQ